MTREKTTTGQRAGDAFATLKRYQFIQLTTFRKTGEAVSTPVWFAQEAGTIYVRTDSRAGKLKRIRHNRRVTLAPSKVNGRVLGASVEGRARILSAEEQSVADKILARKYGLPYRITNGLIKLRGIKRTFLAIQLAQV